MKWVKHLFIIVILLVVVISVIFIPIILLKNKALTQEISTLLEYYGALIGGTITFLGVCITIRHQNKENQKNIIAAEERMRNQLRIENIPVFKYICAMVDSHSGTTEFIECSEQDEKVENLCVAIKIKNIGIKPAKNVCVRTICNNKISDGYGEIESSFIEQGDEVEMFFNFRVPELNSISEQQKDEFSHHIVFVICYYDLIGNKYSQEIDSDLLIGRHLEENDEVQYYYTYEFMKESNPKLLDDSEEYYLPKEIEEFQKEERIKDKMFAGYNAKPDKCLKQLIAKIIMSNETFKSIADLPERMFRGNKLKLRQDVATRFKQISDKEWEVVAECERNNDFDDGVFCFFVIFNLKIKTEEVAIKNIGIYRNTISYSILKLKILEWKILSMKHACGVNKITCISKRFIDIIYRIACKI